MKTSAPILKARTPAELMVEPYIDKIEVARRMKRTVRQVEKMMSDRLIPFYKFDAHAAFRWSEIQAAFAELYRVPHVPSITTTEQIYARLLDFISCEGASVGGPKRASTHRNFD